MVGLGYLPLPNWEKGRAWVQKNFLGGRTGVGLGYEIFQKKIFKDTGGLNLTGSAVSPPLKYLHLNSTISSVSFLY